MYIWLDMNDRTYSRVKCTSSCMHGGISSSKEFLPPLPISLLLSHLFSLSLPAISASLLMFLQSGPNLAAMSPEHQLLHTNEELRGRGAWLHFVLAGHAASTSVHPPPTTTTTRGWRAVKGEEEGEQEGQIRREWCWGECGWGLRWERENEAW